MVQIPFTLIDWSSIEKIRHEGERGFAYWQTIQFEGLRMRIVEYSPGYIADHWCSIGHIVHCLEGSFVNELSTGEQAIMKTGDTYVVSDELSSHRSYSESGGKLMIIDGAFLANREV